MPSVYCKRYYKKHKAKEQLRNKLRRNQYRNILDNLKINGCSNCGYSKDIKKLVFHHVNPEDKEFNLCIQNMAYNDNRIVDELNKCILLCMSCHSRLHNNERWNNGKII